MDTSEATEHKAKFSDFAFVVLSSVIFLTILIVYFYASRSGIEPGDSDSIVGRDFINLYTAGELLAQNDQHILFSGRAYMDVIWAKYGSHYPVHNWSYPPTLFWPASFFSLFDYYFALSLWHMLGVVLIILAVRSLKLHMIWAFLIVFSPAGFLNVLAGQNGYVTAALMTFAFVFAVRKPALSGISWAILTMKPHLGLIALPMVLAQRQWNVILFGAIAFALLVGATIAVWGVEPWTSFLTYTTDQQRFVLENWGGLMYNIVPTAFMQGRFWGIGIPAAYALHAVVAFGGAYLAIRAWPGKDSDVREYMTWFVLATFLILPYSFLYDLVIFQIMLALWHREPEKLLLMRRRFAVPAWKFLWLLPIVSPALVTTAMIQVTPILFIIMLWRRGSAKHQVGQPSLA